MENQEAAKPSVEDRLAAHFAPPEEPKEVTREEPDAEPDVEAQATAQEPDEAPEQEATEVDATDGDGDEEAITLSSLSDLTEHFELDPEDLYKLTVPVSINGKRQDVSLSEWKDSYVAVQEAQKQREEAKAAREALESQRAQAEEQYQAQLVQGAALVDALEKQALAQFDGINWGELRASDPSEWSAKMTELQNAKTQIESVKRGVQQKIQEFQNNQKTTQSQSLEEHLRKEREALYTAWPEMADENKAQPEREALMSELKHRGFTDQEIGQAYDHRILLLARDAMRWRQTASKADAAKKKVVKIGKKVIKPGARQTQAQQRKDAQIPLRNKLKKSGSIHDAVALLQGS